MLCFCVRNKRTEATELRLKVKIGHAQGERERKEGEEFFFFFSQAMEERAKWKKNVVKKTEKNSTSHFCFSPAGTQIKKKARLFRLVFLPA